MDAKRLNTSCSRDAISWLPDEVLGNILSFLPTKQVALTSLLSKKWRHVFSLVDHLEFDDSVNPMTRSYVFPESFKNFVDRTLALQCDYPIKKLSLKCHVGEEDEEQKACVARWIINVVKRSVLELDLRIKSKGIQCLPHQLLTSKSLVRLTIGTKLCPELPSNVSLPSLKFLTIDTIFFEFEDLCCVLLAGCPVLEELSIHHKDFDGMPFTISSLTVKKLLVDFGYPFTYDGRTDMYLDLPKLVYLEYNDCALDEYPLVNLESLVEAKINLCLEVEGEVKNLDVTDLLKGIRNVEILHLSSSSVEVIYFYCRYGLPVFHNMVNLSFGSTNKQGWELLAYLIEQSPKLETLTIQDLNGYTSDVTMPHNKVKVLHILGYRGTEEVLKSFLREFECLERVQVD